ncbi:MAG: cysteine--tRNA ligase [Deltaproteobacteria bacterium]|nr:cysteine--tRNA ligase [Deltaproteobacteria bacterium]MBW1935480.1 cysteine--tRNA ligase [Deltaproteobacteria bacterium]MBW1977456.1 cysteine--tRNA ligase [Deltaproteobacteria bacterium]MBW2043488.1 cysteine--tRNA ligase [Deltaproteobacteria bacterium]MBW2299667.1 cysteine--tRNA ligase [Deltaproteobacteria bacterium]
MKNKYNNILDHIGGTPLVPVTRLNPNPRVEILAKLESFNPGGSVKDRPALYMIEEAEKRGDLTKDKIILEATSGNTGIGLSLVSAVIGYKILLIMSEGVSEERKKILKAMGAELKFTPEHLGTDGAIEFVYNLTREEPQKYWLADQFNNESNWKSHYYGTAAEIWEQTGGNLNAVVAAMGTTGTLMGLSRRLRELNPEVKIVGIEPYLGHKIQGLKNMKESYRPGIFNKALTDRIINIDDEEAYYTSRMLAREEGIFVGMSSGAAMAGALKIAREMNQGRIVVIFPDGGERYLSTPLFEVKRKSGITLYDTLSRNKVEFVPIEESRVKLYSCGPTLCGPIHIGECRRFVFSDLVRRYLEFKGYNVTHIMNLTDLDDRTIEGAEKAGLPLSDFTEKYFHSFLEDLQTLNIKKASEYPRASEHVEDMIEIVRKLVEKGYAYEKLRSVYFDISRFKDYGKLSRIDLEKIKLGKTVDLDLYEKDNPRDFTLLKRSTLNELKRGIFYKTKWGNLRPSWHLECPTIAMKFLGETYDIHMSSVDLIFPHHENIIAISAAMSGRPLANYWLHNELVMVDGKKPSRSAGNEILTLKDILSKGFTGRGIRYWLLSRHYRKPIVFSWANLRAAQNTVSHLDQFVYKLYRCPEGDPYPEMDQLIYDLRHKFKESLDDDFSIAPALAALFEFVGEINRIMDKNGISGTDKEQIERALKRINSVLEVMDLMPQKEDEKIQAFIAKRDRARRAGDWSTADKIRAELEDMGIQLIDTRQGTIWRRKLDSP